MLKSDMKENWRPLSKCRWPVTNNFPKQKDLSRTEQSYCTLKEMPWTLIRQTLVLTCSLRAESLRTLFGTAVGLLHHYTRCLQSLHTFAITTHVCNHYTRLQSLHTLFATAVGLLRNCH